MNTNVESSAASPSSSPRAHQRTAVSQSTAGQPSVSPSASSTAPTEPSTCTSPKKPRDSSQPGGANKAPVRVPSYVSADDILDKAAATRTLKISNEDVLAFTELLTQFREQDYLYVKSGLQRDPAANIAAANHFQQ